MKRKAYGRDAGLSLRMLLTSVLLGLLYVFFALVLFYIFNAGLVQIEPSPQISHAKLKIWLSTTQTKWHEE